MLNKASVSQGASAQSQQGLREIAGESERGTGRAVPDFE